MNFKKVCVTGADPSLQKIHGWKIDVYLLWLAAVTTLVMGLSMPVITFTELIFKKSTFSIISGIVDLYENKERVLAAVIFLFSVIFPIVKLLTLFMIWYLPLPKTRRFHWVDWLGHLGKWSMLDVYILAITIVIAKSSSLIKAEPKRGIYFFGTSVILSIILSLRIKQLARKSV